MYITHLTNYGGVDGKLDSKSNGKCDRATWGLATIPKDGMQTTLRHASRAARLHKHAGNQVLNAWGDRGVGRGESSRFQGGTGKVYTN